MVASSRTTSTLRSVLIPLGALVAGACFFLPYVRLLRVFGASLMLTGPRIGGGLWLVPAAAALVLLAHFGLRPRWLRTAGVLVGSALGLLLVFAVIARLHHRAGMLFVHFSAATFGVRPAVGWAGSLLGFAASLGSVGLWIGLALGLAATAILLTLRFWRLARRLKSW